MTHEKLIHLLKCGLPGSIVGVRLKSGIPCISVFKTGKKGGNPNESDRRAEGADCIVAATSLDKHISETFMEGCSKVYTAEFGSVGSAARTYMLQAILRRVLAGCADDCGSSVCVKFARLFRDENPVNQSALKTPLARRLPVFRRETKFACSIVHDCKTAG